MADELVPVEQTTALTESEQRTILTEEAAKLLQEIIKEKDQTKIKDLTILFNINQNKKTLARQNKLNELLDTITEQALARFTTHPEEISNQELFNGLKITQDMIDKGQKAVNGVQDSPLIQINQQNNSVSVDGDDTGLSTRESRERVKQVVSGILSSINNQVLTQM